MISVEFGMKELSEVYRKEFDSKPMSDVRKDLYRAMADLLSRLRSECRRMEIEDPDSVMLIGSREKRAKAEYMVKAISSCRAHKVYLKALRSADGMDMQLDCLTDEETRYYYEVLASTRRQLSLVHDYMESYEADAVQDDWAEEVQPESMMVIRILEDLPEFAGPERSYCLKKEDVVSIPLSIGAVLVAGNKAVEIEYSS